MTLPRQVDHLIVGAGFAGLCAAIKLAEDGETDYVVIEKAGDVGGTWRDNTYPGACCDVPSQLYSFSFARNPDWSSSYSPQPEIQAYLRRVADDHGAPRHASSSTPSSSRPSGTTRPSAGTAVRRRARSGAQALVTGTGEPLRAATARDRGHSTRSPARCSTPRAGTTTPT